MINWLKEQYRQYLEWEVEEVDISIGIYHVTTNNISIVILSLTLTIILSILD